MTSALIGDRPLRTRVIAPEKPNVAVSAWRAPGGALQFVIVEDDPAGAAGAALRLHVGRGARSASVLELSAPAPNSRSGVLLGGAAVRRGRRLAAAAPTAPGRGAPRRGRAERARGTRRARDGRAARLARGRGFSSAHW